MIVAEILDLAQFLKLLAHDEPARVFATVTEQSCPQGPGTKLLCLAAAYECGGALYTLEADIGTVPGAPDVAPMPSERETIQRAHTMRQQIDAAVTAYGGFPVEGSVVHGR